MVVFTRQSGPRDGKPRFRVAEKKPTLHHRRWQVGFIVPTILLHPGPEGKLSFVVAIRLHATPLAAWHIHTSSSNLSAGTKASLHGYRGTMDHVR